MKTQQIPTLEQAFTGTLLGSIKPEEQIVELDPSELQEITQQPFRVYKSDKLSDLADSIRENGQQQPCIVRKKDGQYIILSGRNRKRACEMLGCKVKCIVKECSDAEADLILTDTNLYQRHELLPSELAYAYAMQKAAYEARGERRCTAAIADSYGETVKTIQRYIKLTKLPKELLDMVDSRQLPLMVGVEISNMSESDMDTTYLFLSENPKLKLSVEQAKELRKITPLTEEKLNAFFYPNKTSPKKQDQPSMSISIKIDELKAINCDLEFESYSKEEVKKYIIDCLADYFNDKAENK